MRKLSLFILMMLLATAIGASAQDMLSTPLTFEATNSGAITFSVTYNYTHPVVLTPVEYQINGGDWTAYPSWPATADEITSSSGNWPVTFGGAIEVNAGDKVAFRGNNASYYGNGKGFECHITSTADVYVYGNMMSLIHASDFATNHTMTDDWNFAKLFRKSGENPWDPPVTVTTIKSHSTNDIVLPATTLVHGVYQNMFQGCTSLTAAPVLPATDLTGGDQCYTSMFQGCTSLVTPPALPATTLDAMCYAWMFSGCTSLATAPALPAMTLAEDCYHRMFEGCTSLTKAPLLPAPTLLGQVYGGMFVGCTSLNYVKCLATDIVDTSHGDDATTTCWLAGVAATGTFVKAAAADWSVKTLTGEALNGIPEGWTVLNDGDDESPVPGDANGDGKVNAEDIVAIIDYMMGKDVAGFKADVADANKDGVVNTADIVSIVNIIMSE